MIARQTEEVVEVDEAVEDFGEMAGHLILRQLGEDPMREGLRQTPQRFSKALGEICGGYKLELADVIGNGVFAAEGNGLVAVKDIEFFSMCEHHMLPFWGRASVAYYPDRQILGLSKIARIVEMYGRRLQVQERLTREVANAINEAISPRAVGVRIQAAHSCMMMRGIKKQSSETLTENFENMACLSELERDRLLAALDG
jgi:GTP cyclohydrolase I